MPTVKRGDSSLYYELHAEPGVAADAPTLVLLHGVGGNHASWFHQTTAWRARWRVLVVDARGFGNSSDAENLGRSAFTDDLLAVLDAAEVGRAVIIGQSMGGATAVDMACSHPQRVRGVVLADTLFGLALEGDAQRQLQAVSEHTATLSQLARVLGPTFRVAQPAASTLYTALASFNRYNVRSLIGVQRQHSPAALAASGVPVLYLVGDEDVLFPAALVRLVHTQTPDSQLVVMPRVGHSAYFEAPEAFNRSVEHWLAGLAT